MRNLRILLVLTFTIAAAHLMADDWPQWRGINRDGKSAETGLLKSWPTEGPKLLRTIPDIGIGWSSPSVVGGKIYITGMINSNLQVFCFGEDGKKLWSKEVGPEFTANFPGARATPTVDKGRVFVLSGVGRLTALDAATGNEAWKVEFSERFKATSAKHGYAEAVLVDSDRVICTPGGADGAFAALNRQTGETVWISKGLKAGAAYCSPIVFEVGGVRQYANTIGGMLAGVRADTGAPLWSYKRPASYRSTATAVFSNGCVFAANGTGTGGGAARIEISNGVAKATQLWETKAMDCEVGGYILVNGYLYGNNGNGWACLDFVTGNAKWKTKPKEPPPGVGKGSIIYADGMLYTFCQDGIMGLAEATPTDYKPICSFRLPATAAPSATATPPATPVAAPTPKPGAAAAPTSKPGAAKDAAKPGPAKEKDAAGGAPKDFEAIAMAESTGHDTWAIPVISGGKLFVRKGDRLFVYAIK